MHVFKKQFVETAIKELEKPSIYNVQKLGKLHHGKQKNLISKEKRLKCGIKVQGKRMSEENVENVTQMLIAYNNGDI